MRRISRATAIVLLAAWPSFAGLARATDYWVTTYSDPAPDFCVTIDCSLREAVRAANQGGSLDRILLSAGTYTLARAGASENAALTGDLDITNDLEIIGQGATMTVIDAAGLDRVIEILGDGTSVRIDGVTIRGGAGTAPAGINVSGGTLTLERSEVRGNVAPMGVPPGGVQVAAFGALIVHESTIADNDGGGLAIVQSTATLENVTLDSNLNADEIEAVGGSVVTCQQCTVRASGDDTAVFATGDGTSVAFANSIVAGSCVAFNAAVVDSEGGNIESAGDTCGFGLASDHPGVSSISLGLGSLADHGGPTRTRVPSPSSAARDQGITPACLAKDQRGLARPVDGDGIPGAFCDVGAVEASVERPPTPIFNDGVEQRSTAAWSDRAP